MEEKIERKLYNEVLQNMMSNCEGKDHYEDYEKLLSVEDTSDYASNHIEIWYPFEDMTIDDFIENVENAVDSLKDLYKSILENNPISKIDFSLLKDQKNEVLILLNQFGEESLANKALEGILNLIDSIQDYAVDVLGRDKNEVFNLSEED